MHVLWFRPHRRAAAPVCRARAVRNATQNNQLLSRIFHTSGGVFLLT